MDKYLNNPDYCQVLTYNYVVFLIFDFYSITLCSSNTTCEGSPYRISTADAEDIVKKVLNTYNSIIIL